MWIKYAISFSFLNGLLRVRIYFLPYSVTDWVVYTRAEYPIPSSIPNMSLNEYSKDLSLRSSSHSMMSLLVVVQSPR